MEDSKKGKSYPEIAQCSVLEDLGVCVSVGGIHFEGTGVHVDGLLVSATFEQVVSFILHPIKFLYHSQMLDGLSVVRIAI